MENNRPFEILSPYERWVPTREQLVQSEYEKLQGNNGTGENLYPTICQTRGF